MIGRLRQGLQHWQARRSPVAAQVQLGQRQIYIMPDRSGAAFGVVLLLIGVSALDVQLGLPTAIAGIATGLGVSALRRRPPLDLVRCVSWGVLPLVAGLFVLVEALDQSLETVGHGGVQEIDRREQVAEVADLVRGGAYGDRDPPQGVEVGQQVTETVRHVDPPGDR